MNNTPTKLIEVAYMLQNELETILERLDNLEDRVKNLEK